jgi:hypothetical protein
MSSHFKVLIFTLHEALECNNDVYAMIGTLDQGISAFSDLMSSTLMMVDKLHTVYDKMDSEI